MIHTGYISVKDKERSEIEAQTKAFKKSGGKVRRIPTTFYDRAGNNPHTNRKRSAELLKKRGLV